MADLHLMPGSVVRIKAASSPTIYPNQYFTDFGGGSGNQFKHIFIGSERILTKKARVAPDRQHWYYHADHLGSTGMVTNENDQLVDAVHYFPFGEVWLEERPSSLPTDYFFTAKELDTETGFYDFGARYLDPRFSKWMTADPALGDYMPGAGKTVGYQSPALANSWRGHPDLPGLGGAFTPSNLALYGYGHQNPASLTDPNGRNADVLRYAPAALPALPAIEALGAPVVAFCVSGPWGWVTCGGTLVIAGGGAIWAMSSSKKDDPAPPARESRFPGDNGGPPLDPDPDPKKSAIFNLMAVGGIVIATRYGTLSKQLPTGYQANHLNQDAAYRDIIPSKEGLANPLRGNPNLPDSPHAKFHQSLNQFWRPYQRGGEQFGKSPTNAQYGQALEEALKEAGVSPTEASQLSGQARAQRNEYGLGEASPVPRIPGSPR